MSLPPDYVLLEPLDSLAWTSTENGYSAKAFEISGLTEDPMTLHQHVMTRERDAADFSYPSLPAPTPISILPVIPSAQTVPSFAVSGTSILDSTGVARRPALQLTWEPDLSDVTGIMWEVRLQATGVIVARNSTQNVATGSLLVAEGIIASTAYEARALPVVDRPSAWTSWTPATTPATLITSPDIAVGAVGEKIQSISLGPWNEGSLPTNVVLVTLDLGAVGVGQGWARRLHFEARKASSTVPLVVEVQRRRAVLGGALGSWVTVETLSIDTVGWDVYADSGSLAGTYDDFEYRVIMTDNGNTNSASTDLIRNIYLTLVRITKE